MTRRPTIIDVAELAGVSKSTVSLVLRDSPLVRPATRAAIETAMATLGYVYNRAAANLRSAHGGLVGLVINDLRNPFFTEFAASAQTAFALRGYATAIVNTDEDPQAQDRVIRTMIEHGVAALLILPAYGGATDAFEPILQAGTPAMQVLRRVDARGELFPFAAPDYVAGGRLAAEHLLGRGARRIAFVGGVADRPVTRERMSGYVAAVEAAGLEPVAFPGQPTRGFGREVAAALIAARPRIDAALCFSDLVALGVLAGLLAAGVRPGADFRLVGFDDIEEAALAWPPLSSVRCDVAAFGRDAAATMLGWLETGVRPPPALRTPVELVLRATSG